MSSEIMIHGCGPAASGRLGEFCCSAPEISRQPITVSLTQNTAKFCNATPSKLLLTTTTPSTPLCSTSAIV